MKAFRATYKPRHYDDNGHASGYEESKKETVLVLDIKVYEEEKQSDVVFVHSNGDLDVNSMDCFTECQAMEHKN